jgi:hypothetical protein
VAVLHGKLILLGRMAVVVVALIPFFDLINQSYTVGTNNARAIVFLAFTTFDAVLFLSTVLVGFLVRAAFAASLLCGGECAHVAPLFYYFLPLPQR